MRWKALAEIYTMHFFASVYKLKTLFKNRFKKLCQHFATFLLNLSKVRQILAKDCQNFAGICQKSEAPAKCTRSRQGPDRVPAVCIFAEGVPYRASQS